MPEEEPIPRTARLSRLLDRVVQQRRRSLDQAESPEDKGRKDRLAALEERVLYLESLLEGLQDSVHRVAIGQEQEIEALRQKTEPAQLARALGRYTQQQGL
jgi:transcription elongation GreA/GreB family factor